MSTATTDVAPVVSLKPPARDERPSHEVCWLFIEKKASGDIYTGLIFSSRLVGTTLKICLNPITRVKQYDSSDDLHKGKHWTALSPIRSASFEFEGCKKIDGKSDEEKVVYISSTGDTIILSNKPEDVKATNSLFVQP